ncbi:MAG: KamA family radical SAM protein [Candidatus Cloacimonetes bacterium]|nr:KamA family radical SAM protein [Candidatus Cloacimonadota bacterium]MCF7812874.1 KamA family radical SAM protein [Candidatus Cloacimonadota bacterium]MCF7867086.1 KamA family radical SAM protein [Candidatus Cloacimonadota bacterium]MCF7882594.1 KamA family radical SAM protein [Candidatus Cloacimonadota bacterium]
MYWKNELKKNIITIDQLKKFLPISKDDEKWLKKVIDIHPMSVSRHYLSLIDFKDSDDPIKKMVIPAKQEMDVTGSYDTSGELSNTKFLGFQHKYPQTVLILSTHRCASYCRFCFRKRLVGVTKDEVLNNINKAVTYINKHPEVNNILITGGDPLVLSTKIIIRFLEKLTTIPHIDFIRFGTKVPVYLPSRIYDSYELLAALKKHSKIKQIYFVTHVDHPREITPELRRAISKLLKSRVIVNNQTVLMRGVNDDPNILAELQNKLVSSGINPYYVFQCRPVKRVKNHFQLPILEGYRIVEKAKTMLNGHSKRFRYVMSHKTGKVEIIGPKNDEMIFKYHQAKDARNNGRIFTRKISKTAGWLDEFAAK